MSVAFEYRFSLRSEGFVRAPEVRRLHERGLRDRLDFECGFQRQSPLLVQHPLGHAVCKRGARGQLSGQRLGFGNKDSAGMMRL